jgi:hypothetical protein
MLITEMTSEECREILARTGARLVLPNIAA